MKKGINNDSMSSLLDGLTSFGGTQVQSEAAKESSVSSLSSENPVEPKRAKTKPSKEQLRKRVCTSIDTTLIHKVRAISKKEQLPINEIIELGMKMVIEKYEKTHGQIAFQKDGRGDIKNIFRK